MTSGVGGWYFGATTPGLTSGLPGRPAVPRQHHDSSQRQPAATPTTAGTPQRRSTASAATAAHTAMIWPRRVRVLRPSLCAFIASW